jgi:hypothetical protein
MRDDLSQPLCGNIHTPNTSYHAAMYIGEARCASDTRPPIEYQIRSATQRALTSDEDASDDTTPVWYTCPSGSRSAAVIQRSSNGTPTRVVRQCIVLLYSTWPSASMRAPPQFSEDKSRMTVRVYDTRTQGGTLRSRSHLISTTRVPRPRARHPNHEPSAMSRHTAHNYHRKS